MQIHKHSRPFENTQILIGKLIKFTQMYVKISRGHHVNLEVTQSKLMLEVGPNKLDWFPTYSMKDVRTVFKIVFYIVSFIVWKEDVGILWTICVSRVWNRRNHEVTLKTVK